MWSIPTIKKGGKHMITVSNNLANVNTVEYKRETVNFKSLLYENMGTPNILYGLIILIFTQGMVTILT